MFRRILVNFESIRYHVCEVMAYRYAPAKTVLYGRES